MSDPSAGIPDRPAERVFISYAAEDSAIARRIADALVARGMRPWRYEVDVPGGRHYMPAITGAIRESKAVVALLSNGSIVSPQVISEVTQAFERRVQIVPVRVGIPHERILASDDLAHALAGVNSLEWDLPDGAACLQAIVRALAVSVPPALPHPPMCGSEAHPGTMARYRWLGVIGLVLMGAAAAGLLAYGWGDRARPSKQSEREGVRPAAPAPLASETRAPPAAEEGVPTDANAIWEAVAIDDAGWLETLLKCGDVAKLKRVDGQTALHRAAFHGSAKVIPLLVAAKVPIDAIEPQNRKTALHVACQRGHAAVVGHLLEAGARTDMRIVNGDTALHLAVLAQEPERVVQLLLDAKADVAATNAAGETPLHLAAQYHALGAVQVLIRAGVDVNAQSGIGATPLLLAVRATSSPADEERALALIAVLLGANATTSLADRDGVTPFAWATSQRLTRISDRLREHEQDAASP